MSYNKRQKCQSHSELMHRVYISSFSDEQNIPNIDPNMFFENNETKIDPNNPDKLEIIQNKIDDIYESDMRDWSEDKVRLFRIYKEFMIRICHICKIAIGLGKFFIQCEKCDKHVCYACFVPMRHVTECCKNCFEDDCLKYYEKQKSFSLINKRDLLHSLTYLSKDVWNIVFYYAFNVIVNMWGEV